MKANLKPANAKAWALFKKLLALAERGIDGERTAALRKLERLRARLDFSGSDPADGPDLFSGKYRHSSAARPICSFSPHEWDLANSIKWAIESGTGIKCLYRGKELLAEAAPPTIKRLQGIALHIASSFRALIERFSMVEGLRADDRGAFVMGLYDGMMNDPRKAGQALPSRPGASKRRKGKQPAASKAGGLHVHPYTLAVELGKQIRFSAPLEQLMAELDVATQKFLAQRHEIQSPG